MSKLLATTFTVLAASGCAAVPPTDPVDDEPPPSSRPIRHVSDAVYGPSEKNFDITKPGDPRPTATSESACGGPVPPTDAWPDGDPKSDPTFAPDFPGGPSGVASEERTGAAASPIFWWPTPPAG
jgi:hypothetical protein